MQYFCKQVAKLDFPCLLWPTFFHFKQTCPHARVCTCAGTSINLYVCLQFIFPRCPVCPTQTSSCTSHTYEVSWAKRKITVNAFPWMLAVLIKVGIYWGLPVSCAKFHTQSLTSLLQTELQNRYYDLTFSISSSPESISTSSFWPWVRRLTYYFLLLNCETECLSPSWYFSPSPSSPHILFTPFYILNNHGLWTEGETCVPYFFP